MVKLGTKVGVDLLLYPEGGPVLEHAQYGVSIRVLSSSPSTNYYEPSWGVATRVLETVAKYLLVALATPPSNEVEQQELDSYTPTAFRGWKLDELVLSRWQSTSTTKSSLT